MHLQVEQIARIQDLIDELHFLAADVTERLGACFLHNDDASGRFDGNHVRRIRLPPGVTVEAFFAEVERYYADLPFRAVRVDPFTTPPGVEARLLLDGYQCSTEIVMAAAGPLGGSPAAVEIATLRDEAGWEDLKMLKSLDGEGEQAVREIMALERRIGDAFTCYLARVEGQAVGHFSQRTRSGLGYLEDLFVHPDYRHRGIATALVHHTAAAARAEGARLVFLPTAANDTPKEMYARMGFEPVYAFRNYWRRAQDPGRNG